MTVAETLRKARALIDTPEKWCKGTYARDCSMCSLGAITAAIGADPKHCHAWLGIPAAAYESADFFEASLGKRVAAWNDDEETTHPDVMAAFDKAIALAEQEGR